MSIMHVCLSVFECLCLCPCVNFEVRVFAHTFDVHIKSLCAGLKQSPSYCGRGNGEREGGLLTPAAQSQVSGDDIGHPTGRGVV
jgi:hypothetical protein